MQATVDSVARYGITKTTVEDVARLAGLSRATVYRHFPGGKDELVKETVAWEAGKFFDSLRDALGGREDLAEELEDALLLARQAVIEHAVLQKVLQTEPELLLPVLLSEMGWLLALVSSMLQPALEKAPLRDGVTAAMAGDRLARMLLSLVEAPGQWDLTSRDEVRRLVRTHLVPSVCAR